MKIKNKRAILSTICIVILIMSFTKCGTYDIPKNLMPECKSSTEYTSRSATKKKKRRK